MASQTKTNPRYCTQTVSVKYAHVGLYDVLDKAYWIARKRFGVAPVKISHARLLKSGTNTTSTADKDRFICCWFHTPNTGAGFVHGYPIEWQEGHLLVRLDPNWDYQTQQYIPSSDIVRVERNVEQQYEWGRRVFRIYCDLKPTFALSWHMVGPRAADSMFYVDRVEAVK